MKKWIFSFALLISTSIAAPDNQMMIEHAHDHAPKAFVPGDAKYLEPSSVHSGYLVVKPMKIEGFDAASTQKLEDAFEALERVVNTVEFKERILNFKNTKGERAFASNRGLTNEQIYAQFMDGRETLQQNTPGEMNFFLKLYHRRFSKVIGWTNPDINTIHINWKYFRTNKVNSVAANLAHEWLHKIGFGHKSASEHDSAPYAIGYIVGEMVQRHLKGEELH
jgi:hypothetical protein